MFAQISSALLVGDWLGIAAVFAVVTWGWRTASQTGDGPARAAVRILASLMLPAIVLAFLGLYWWPLSVAASVAIAYDGFRRAGGYRKTMPAARSSWSPAVVPVVLALALCAVKSALAVASTPYDIDSVMYHVPMAIEFLLAHAVGTTPIMFHPGSSELLDSIGLGIAGRVGGQTLTEAVVVLALFLAAVALAQECGADRVTAMSAASAVVAIPMVGDQLFTAQNDVLVGALLLAFLALWRRHPLESAIAAGLVGGVKFTGAVEIVAMLPILWKSRSPALAPWHAAVALLIAAPWYVRNGLVTGNPFYLGGMTAGWPSTIAAHLVDATPYLFMALRNYGGLLAIVGILALVLLVRDTALAETLVPLLPALVAAVLVVWLIIPNAGQDQPLPLNQIRSGWSIRYVLVVPMLLTIASIVCIGRTNVPVAVAVSTLAVAAVGLREFRASVGIDHGIVAFVAALFAAFVLLAWGLAGTRRESAIAGVAGFAIFVLSGMAGVTRIAAVWDTRYQQQAINGDVSLGPALSLPQLKAAGVVGALNAAVLPLMGPSLQRYAVANLSGLPPLRVWQDLEAARPVLVFARDVPMAPNTVDPDELLLRRSQLFRQIASIDGTRIYARR
jgi:hypothetical protein